MQTTGPSFGGTEPLLPLDWHTWRGAATVTSVDRVRCVLWYEQRFLMAQHHTRRPENRDKWGLVGGRLKRGEEPSTALRRELIEEIGLNPRQLVELGDWVCRGETYRVFGCALTAPPRYADPHEIRALGWFSHADVIELAQSRELHKGFEGRAIGAFRARFAV